MHPIHANDILPTVAAAAGAELPDDRIIDGVNLLPFVLNHNSGKPHETLLATGSTSDCSS